ncbi:type II secretion system F family protein [Amycolatopsis pigmentata]|uniref:Type II secretion system F family protein n=1 Tax=Amycolatopsis pigmentata TaxID=450801 RepID=A0ABW5G9B6_9PSEU
MTLVWPGFLGVLALLSVGCTVAAFRPTRGRGTETPGVFAAIGGLAQSGRRVLARIALRRLLVAVVVAVVVWWTSGWPVAAVLAAAGVVTVPVLARGDDPRRLIARLDALASWVRRLADLLSSGAGGLEQAITTSAHTAPEALAIEVQTLAVRLRTRGLEPALRAFADDLDDEAADEVVLALIVRARAGGRGLADILDAKAKALDAEVVARRDVEADRAKPRTDVRTILAITAALLAGLMVFAHDFLTPFDEMLGQLVMAGIGVLLGAAGWWMHLLTRARRPVRLLGGAAENPAGTPKPPRRLAVVPHTTEVPR